jgi:hypothetical protein
MSGPNLPKTFTLNLDALPKFEPFKLDLKFVNSLSEIALGIAKIQWRWSAIKLPLFEGFTEAFRNSRKADAVLAAGWVPHPATPLAEIDESATPAEIDLFMGDYYRNNWSSFRTALSVSVQASGIDEEAKATFEEGLSAHDAGLYRSVVRLLFPEIERVTREAIYGGSRREPPRPRQTKGSLNTGLKSFREALMSELPVGVVLETPFALSLVEKLYDHLYEYVPENPDGLAIFARDPVPNRNASQHGYVVYASAQHSLNMLAMSDFMFNIIMRVRAYMDEVEKRGDQNA